MTSTRQHLGRCALLLAALTAPTTAQILRGGRIVMTDSASAAIHVVDANGAVIPLPHGGLVTGPRGVAADGDSIVVCDWSSDSLVRIDANGAASIVVPGLSRPLRVAVDRDGSYLVTNQGTGSIVRVFRGGAIGSFLSSGTGGITSPFDVLVDGDGTYVVTDDSTGGIYRVGRRGAVTPIHVGAPLVTPRDLAQFPNGDYAVLDASASAVLRVDRVSGAVTTWLGAAGFGGTPAGLTEAFDGGFFVGDNAAPTQLLRIEPWQTTTIVAPAPLAVIEDVTRMPFLIGPQDMTTGPGSATTLQLDLPALPNTAYTLALAGSLFPGLPLPGGDPRAVTITADGLMLATFGANLPPLLTNWTAVTDASGRATIGFDLSTLPAGLLSGRTLFAQGLAVRPGAWNGIDTITNPIALSFR